MGPRLHPWNLLRPEKARIFARASLGTSPPYLKNTMGTEAEKGFEGFLVIS